MTKIYNFSSKHHYFLSNKLLQGKNEYRNQFKFASIRIQGRNEAIVELKKKFGDKINFISISADKQFLNLHYYLEKHKYDWCFLFSGNDNDLFEAYEIRTYPVFILLDAKGNIINYPALKPSENIENVFKSLIEKESLESKE